LGTFIMKATVLWAAPGFVWRYFKGRIGTNLNRNSRRHHLGRRDGLSTIIAGRGGAGFEISSGLGPGSDKGGPRSGASLFGKRITRTRRGERNNYIAAICFALLLRGRVALLSLGGNPGKKRPEVKGGVNEAKEAKEDEGADCSIEKANSVLWRAEGGVLAPLCVLGAWTRKGDY